MKHFFMLVFVVATCCPAMGQIPARVADKVFAEWGKPSSPGCALAVVRDGQIIYERGYGMANLELGIPITPQTVFDIGSLSKQFTAMSIVLLAQDGKLTLEDDIHLFIPELPDYGWPVTLRQMLHHVSGLRSYTDLFDLAGIPEIDLTMDDDALQLITRQMTLNFRPGEEYLYSDTNYFLLSIVVKRVTGQTIRQFAHKRIFEPLGMTSTHFHDDHTMIVPRRATGYAPHEGGGFEIDMSNFEELGDGSIMTTVEDLFRWDQNFYHPIVGGQSAIDELEKPGILNSGRSTTYGMGLIMDRYRGLRRVQHTGEWVGYRSALSRFPEQKFTVIVLCNVLGDLNTLALTERIADIYLADQLQSIDTATPTHRDIPAQEIASYAGAYWNKKTGAFLKFSITNGKLALQSTDSLTELVPLGNGQFQGPDSSTHYFFRQPQAGATLQVECISDDAGPIVLKKMQDAQPKFDDLSRYPGAYYSRDLNAVWNIVVKDGHLVRKQWMFKEQVLQPAFGDAFIGDLSEGQFLIHFTRDTSNRIVGFTVATEMVRPVSFVRVRPPKVSRSSVRPAGPGLISPSHT